MLAFDIAQFFPSINHQLLLLILNEPSFDSKISLFFSSYLMNRQTQYVWNNFVSPFFGADVGVDQRSALSLILSALYILPIFHIFKKRTSSLLSPISLFFVTIVFLFLRKKAMKNQTPIYFIVIVFFLLFLNNLVL